MNPPYRLIPKAILLELFLHEVTSFSKDVIRALSGCFRGGFVNVSFLFISKRKENFQRCEDLFFDNLIASKGASVNTFGNFKVYMTQKNFSAYLKGLSK